MKKFPHAAIAFLAGLMVGLPAANADPPPAGIPGLQGVSLDQYPSFIAISGTTQGMANAAFELRCGYTVVGGRVTLDPSLNDFSMIDSSSRSYNRCQAINGRLVVTTLDPAAGGRRVIIQVTEPDGSLRAKNCMVDMSTDIIANCIPAAPFMPAAQVWARGNSIAQQCGTFVQQAKLDPAIFDAVQTDQFKRNLEGKLMVLESN